LAFWCIYFTSAWWTHRIGVSISNRTAPHFPLGHGSIRLCCELAIASLALRSSNASINRFLGRIESAYLPSPMTHLASVPVPRGQLRHASSSLLLHNVCLPTYS